MKEVWINENMQGNKLKELLLFVSRRSNKMSLARYYEGNLTLEEFEQMQMEYKTSIIEEDKKRRLSYNENINGYRNRINEFCETEKKAEEYFNRLLKQDLRIYSMLKYDDFQDRKYVSNSTDEIDFISVKYTRISSVTKGPVFEMCYFELGNTYRKITLNMNKLFEYPYYIQDNEFEDLTLYNGSRKVLAICSHEQYAYMNLEDDEYEELLVLGILSDLAE